MQKQAQKVKNYRKIMPKKYGAGITFIWMITIILVALLGYLTYKFIVEPEYVPDGNLMVLSTLSWVKIILAPLGILLVILFANILITRIKLAKAAYLNRYLEWLKEQKLKQQEKQKKQPEPIVLPEQEELEEEDDDVENRRVFFDQSELSDVIDMFMDYCKDNGFTVGRGLVTELFSAIACSRLILVKGLETDGLTTLSELVCGFFLGNSYLDCIDEEGGADKTSSDFFDWIKSCKKTGRLHFATIDCKNFSALMEVYGEFIPSLVAPEKINSYETFEKYGCTERFVFPPSVWCLVGIGDSIFMPKELVKNGVVLNLSKTEFASQEFSSLRIEAIAEIPTSFLRFSGMINEEMGRNSLSLESWKKIDHVEDYLKVAGEEYFDNKICRQIERYVGFEMAGSLSEEMALDRVLANKILPFVSAVPKESFKENQERVSEFIDRIFALQNLPLCELYLTEMSTARDLLELQAVKQVQEADKATDDLGEDE